MTEEEIKGRISICEYRRRGYQEIGNTKIADKYSNEIYKWEKLLNKLDPKRDEQLRDYKIGYELLKEIIANAKNILCEIDHYNMKKEYGKANLLVVKLRDILKEVEIIEYKLKKIEPIKTINSLIIDDNEIERYFISTGKKDRNIYIHIYTQNK